MEIPFVLDYSYMFDLTRKIYEFKTFIAKIIIQIYLLNFTEYSKGKANKNWITKLSLNKSGDEIWSVYKIIT